MEPAATDQRPPAGARRGTGLLAAGSVISGLLAYVFFALVTRALGRGAGRAGGGALGVVELRGGGLHVPGPALDLAHRRARPPARPPYDVGCRASPPLVDRGLGRSRARWPGWRATGCSARTAPGSRCWSSPSGSCSGALGLARGTLSGRHRFGAVGVGLVLENGLRCVVAGDPDGERATSTPASYGLALLAGYAAIGLRPSALVPAHDRHRRATATRWRSSRARRPASCSPRSR